MSNKYPQFPNTQFPESVDTYSQFLDMTISDFNLVKEYQQALEKGDRASAVNILAQIPNNSQKLLSELKLNQLRDAVLAMEQFYSTDVESHIKGHQTEWEAYIDRFEYKGDWASSKLYKRNNIVRFIDDGNIDLYINTKENTLAGVPPTDIGFWRKLTVKGAKGEGGDGANFAFEWNADDTYTQGSIVVYRNQWWIAKKENRSEVPSNGSEFWEFVLQVSQAIYPISYTQPIGQINGEFWMREGVELDDL